MTNEVLQAAGNDTLTSDGGNDTFIGGSGQTTYVYDGLGTTTIEQSASSDVLMFGPGISASNIVTTQQTTNDVTDTTFTLASGGQVVVDGGALSQVEFSDGTSLTLAQMATSVYSAVTTALPAGYTNLVLTGANIYGYANGASDVLTAGSGNDSLNGGPGNDTLIAAGNNDSLFGGTGNETMVGGGNTTYMVDQLSALGTVIENSTSSDTLAFSTMGAYQSRPLIASDLIVSETMLANGQNEFIIEVNGDGAPRGETIVQGGALSQVSFADGTTTSLAALAARGLNGGTTVYNADGSYNVFANDGNGDTSNTSYNATGVKLNDVWIKSDGTSGGDSFNVDGSSYGETLNPDGSYSTYNNDGQGYIGITDYTVYGVVTAEGYQQNGTSGLTTFHADGSYSAYTNDGSGDTSTTNYSAAGVMLSESWTSANGMSGSDTFNANGSSYGMTTNADGSYSDYTNDGAGDLFTTNYSTAGVKLGDNWTNSNGTSGSDSFNADGSSIGMTVNIDRSYSVYSNDGAGDLLTTNYSAASVELSDTWTRSNGTSGSDTFNADGSSTGETTNADGSYSDYTNDGIGDLFTINYSATGVKLSDSWTNSNGTSGGDAFNGDGSLNHSIITDAAGDVTQLFYGTGNVLTSSYTYTTDNTATWAYFAADGSKLNDSWTKADGSSGTDVFNPDGSIASSTVALGTGNIQVTPGNANTTVTGGDGNDSVTLGTGTDVVTVGNGSDSITGGGAITITAGNGNDLLQGGAGASSITVGSGNDTLIAGSGLATLVGGSGNDFFVINNTGDVVQAQATSSSQIQSSVSYVMPANVLVLAATGNTALTLTGNAGDDFIASNFGQDTLIAGSGDDTFLINNSSDVIIEATHNSDSSVLAMVNYVLPANLQNLMGGYADGITLTGNTLKDVITADGNNDTLVAGSGLATLVGAGNNETFVVNRSGDVISEPTSGTGSSVLSSVSYTLGANLQTLTGTGNADMTLTGNGLNDVITATGNGFDTLVAGSGNTTLVSGSGYDTLIGGSGNDTFVVSNTDDLVEAKGGAGINTVDSSANFVLPANIQALTLTGNANLIALGNGGNDLIVGNSGADTIVGGAGTSVLEAGSGNSTLTNTGAADALIAGSGNDTLTASSGNQFIAGGSGNDTIKLGSGNAVVAFNAGDGKATIAAGGGNNNVLSLGGGINYSNLTFSKNGSNLILNTGGNNAITFTNWYSGKSNQDFVTLQVVEQAAAGFSPTSSNALINQNVEEFNFAQLVSAFNSALAANPTLTSWSLMNNLVNAHLSGSNTTALGGDLGYYDGLNGNLTGLNMATAVSTLQSNSFGKAAQTIDAWNGVSTSNNKLH